MIFERCTFETSFGMMTRPWSTAGFRAKERQTTDRLTKKFILDKYIFKIQINVAFHTPSSGLGTRQE